MVCPRDAKAAGVKNVVSIHEVKQICPDRSVVPQKLDLSQLYHDEIAAKASYKNAAATARRFPWRKSSGFVGGRAQRSDAAPGEGARSARDAPP